MPGRGTRVWPDCAGLRTRDFELMVRQEVEDALFDVLVPGSGVEGDHGVVGLGAGDAGCCSDLGAILYDLGRTAEAETALRTSM